MVKTQNENEDVDMLSVTSNYQMDDEEIKEIKKQKRRNKK